MSVGRITVLIVIILVLLILSFLGLIGRSVPIVQPIPFNHNLHVEEQDLECTECHTQVTKHARATLPSIKTCEDCHSDVLTETEIESQLLVYVYEESEIPWQRIYKVPDHVYFSHRRHVTLGNVKCESCHGNVWELTEPPEFPLIPITMTNCMKCHEEHQITNDCLACHR